MENFWSDGEDNGTYLTVKLMSGKSLKEKGWPWIQQCIRGILGGNDKVAKASFLSDGRLLVKTKDTLQTEKLQRARMFGEEECVVERDQRLNQSRGTIHAVDLMDLSESEIVGWLGEFGVVSAKRFTRKVGSQVEKTPTLLLTFDRPSCPKRLEFDYVVYQVRQHIPNPLICLNCGKYGHIQARCRVEAICLHCGGPKHEGTCEAKCINCGQSGHGCMSRQCSAWLKEKDICRIKVTKDISYSHARRVYDQEHNTPALRPYASVVRTSAETGSHESLQNRVGNIEQKLDKMVTLLDQLIQRLAGKHTTMQHGGRGSLDPEHIVSQDQDQDKQTDTQGTDRQEAEQVMESVPECRIPTQASFTLTPSGGTDVHDSVSDPDEVADSQPEPSHVIGNRAPQGTSEWHVAGTGKGYKKKQFADRVKGKVDDITPSPQIIRKQGTSHRRMPSLTRMGTRPLGGESMDDE